MPRSANVSRIDKTYETTSHKITKLWANYGKLLREINEQTSLFRSKSKYRLSFTQGQRKKMLDGKFTLTLDRLNSEISEVLSRLTTKQLVLVGIMDEIRYHQDDRETLKERSGKAGYASAWPY